MTAQLKRRKPPKTKERAGDYPTHRQWIRGHYCVVEGCMDGPIVAAHVRNSDLTPPEQKGGTGIKPHDQWTVPMCDVHHSEQHAIGEPAFERKYSLNLGASAIKLAAMSPHRRRWEDTENG